MGALIRRSQGVDGDREFGRGTAQGERLRQSPGVAWKVEVRGIVAQQLHASFARKPFLLHLARQFEPFALAPEPFVVPELAACALAFD